MDVLGQRLPHGELAARLKVGWVILDWSGTLSATSVAFGRPDSLRAALKEAGLAESGLEDPERFWREIVIPTWQEGSTSAIGYGALIARQLVRSHPAGAAIEPELLRRARRFVGAYLEASAPDPIWRPLLERWSRHPGLRLLIATDHYAEATEAFLRHLEAWGVPVRVLRWPLASDPRPEEAAAEPAPIYLANSADVGATKDSPRFWGRVRRLLPERPVRAWVIDDFGANELSEDPYSAASRRRQERVLSAMAESWRVPVEGFWLLVPDLGRDPEAALTRYRSRVHEAAQWLERRLRAWEAGRLHLA